MITQKRLDELHCCSNNETNDPDTQEWRDELTAEDSELVDEWDKQYTDFYDVAMRKIAEQKGGD